MPKKLENPADKKISVSVALKKSTCIEMDKNCDKLRKHFERVFEIPEEKKPAFYRVFSRSALLGEVAEVLATKYGYELIKGGFGLALESLGFQQKNKDQMDMFGDED